MGSQSDMDVMRRAGDALEEFDVAYTIQVTSAHRNPDEVAAWAKEAVDAGYRVLIAGAGRAAHLPGVVAAHTPLPVIGVPILSAHLGGADSLYSIVQMPPGVPVATVGLDAARNAGLLAVQILATGDEGLRDRFVAYKRRLAEESRRPRQSVGFTAGGGR
ncbi:MAG: 5-(carboxyamino)imidazole ribonucleotide mutase [Actinobacteria bacterium]|nr:5-(carboxyamino)imidazole ribonucleotide mutase [Actinomycetota bacterium]